MAIFRSPANEKDEINNGLAAGATSSFLRAPDFPSLAREISEFLGFLRNILGIPRKKFLGIPKIS